MPKILIIEDDEKLREELKILFISRAKYIITFISQKVNIFIFAK